jgi:hypothetical protein
VTEQLTLAGTPEPTPTLTGRQLFALDLIRELGPIPSDELGAHMHERRGKHSTDIRCSWCAQEGESVGKELRRKQTLGIKHRRGEGWIVALREKSKGRGGLEGDGYDPATAPFPEGF